VALDAPAEKVEAIVDTGDLRGEAGGITLTN
jgi:hypothetical protein